MFFGISVKNLLCNIQRLPRERNRHPAVISGDSKVVFFKTIFHQCCAQCNTNTTTSPSAYDYLVPANPTGKSITRAGDRPDRPDNSSEIKPYVGAREVFWPSSNDALSSVMFIRSFWPPEHHLQENSFNYWWLPDFPLLSLRSPSLSESISCGVFESKTQKSETKTLVVNEVAWEPWGLAFKDPEEIRTLGLFHPICLSLGGLVPDGGGRWQLSHGISQGARKLAQTPQLLKKKREKWSTHIKWS